MSATAEASFLIRQLADPVDYSVKARKQRVYRKLGTWTFNRVCDVWKADPRITVSAKEIDQLRELNRIKKEEANREETRQLLRRVAELEAWMAEIDPQFSRKPSSMGQSAPRDAGSEEG